MEKKNEDLGHCTKASRTLYTLLNFHSYTAIKLLGTIPHPLWLLCAAAIGRAPRTAGFGVPAVLQTLTEDGGSVAWLSDLMNELYIAVGDTPGAAPTEEDLHVSSFTSLTHADRSLSTLTPCESGQVSPGPVDL